MIVYRNSIRKVGTAVLALATASFGLVAQAHHSHAMFDEDKETTLTGKVAAVSYMNPHVYLSIETKGANNTPEKWSIEMSHIGNMMSRGVTRETLKVGDEVVLQMNPLRDGKTGGSYTRIISINGVKNAAEGSNWAAAK